MARRFTAASHEVIGFDPGNLASLDGGPITVAWIWSPNSLHAGCLLYCSGTGQVILLNPFFDGRVYFATSGSGPATETYTASDGWRLLAVTKADGSSTVRGHSYDYGDQAWTHTDYSTKGDSTNGPVTTVQVGRNNGFNEYLNADLAVVGVWGSVLTDNQLEGLTDALIDWVTLSPAALWAFNQSSVASDVLDISGGGADQSSITGTSVVSDPPGFDYAITAGAGGPHVSSSFTPADRSSTGGRVWSSTVGVRA